MVSVQVKSMPLVKIINNNTQKSYVTSVIQNMRDINAQRMVRNATNANKVIISRDVVVQCSAVIHIVIQTATTITDVVIMVVIFHCLLSW